MDDGIIPYQEIIGNYSRVSSAVFPLAIIPYQEIIGNYSLVSGANISPVIIPYQEIIGNYSAGSERCHGERLYHTKK